MERATADVAPTARHQTMQVLLSPSHRLDFGGSSISDGVPPLARHASWAGDISQTSTSRRERESQKSAMEAFVSSLAAVMDIEAVRERVQRLSQEATGSTDLAHQLKQEVNNEVVAVGTPLLHRALCAYVSAPERLAAQVLDEQESLEFFADYSEMQLRHVPSRLAGVQLGLSGEPVSEESQRQVEHEIFVRIARSMVGNRSRWVEFCDTNGDGLLQFDEVHAALLGPRADEFARLTLASVDEHEQGDTSEARDEERVQIFGLASGYTGSFTTGMLRRTAVGLKRFFVVLIVMVMAILLFGGAMAWWLFSTASHYPQGDIGGTCLQMRVWLWVMGTVNICGGLIVAIGALAVKALRVEAGRSCYKLASPLPLFLVFWLIYGEYIQQYGDYHDCPQFRDRAFRCTFVLVAGAIIFGCLGCYAALRFASTLRGVSSPPRKVAAGETGEARAAGEGARIAGLIEMRSLEQQRLRSAMEQVAATPWEQAKDALLIDRAVTDWAEAQCAEVTQRSIASMVAPESMQMPWIDYLPIGRFMAHPSRAGEQMEVSFGSNMRELYFCLPECFLNSASYGATPRPVLHARRLREVEFQRNPVLWRFTTLTPRLAEARMRLARVIGTDPSHLTILANANAATSVVLKSLPWRLGDRILVFSVEYPATILACGFLTRTYGVEVVELPLCLPMSDAAVLSAVRIKLEQMEREPGGLPKLANFCHVTSSTAWIFPARELCQLFHEFGVSVIVDGAQAAGHLKGLSVRNVAADWYIGTAHKWMYSCPGVGFLVTQPHKYGCTFPLTVSYNDKAGYEKEFSYYGLQDWSTWFSAIDGLDFVDKVCGGWDAVFAYREMQAQCVINVFKEEFANTSGPAWLLDWHLPVQGTGRYGSMPLMPLPWASREDATSKDAAKVMGYLLSSRITAFVLVVPVQGIDGVAHGTLCVRCACQIYTHEGDWRRVAKRVSELRGEYKSLAVLKEVLLDAARW